MRAMPVDWRIDQLARDRPRIVGYLRRRMATGDADELADQVIVELTERVLSERRPAVEEAPESASRSAFTRLALLVARRRLHDQIRQKYRSRIALTSLDTSGPRSDPDEALDARRALEALVREIYQLSVDDRELLLDASVKPTVRSAMNAVQRQRVKRLRSLLRQRLGIRRPPGAGHA
jgi:DNA-directed RNA polymerase specialized sigma24 family protein